jgi:L-alanine-DL-glutamate epimerase-like enolase superfamily enzyme
MTEGEDGAGGGSRIERLELSIISFPLDPPFRAAVALIRSVTFILAELRTSCGASGIGYGFVFHPSDAKAIREIAASLGELLKGERPADVERLWRRMWDRLVFLGQSGAGVSALAILDMAIWDLRGRLSGLPIWALLGRTRDEVPVYGSGGSLAASLPDLVAEMERHASAGYPAVKMKIGQARITDDAERVRAVRRAIGPERKIILDANQQWTAKQAIAMAAHFTDLDIWWLEEPVPAADVEGCAMVARAVPFAVATGETSFTPAEFARLIDARAADILMPNLQRVGGITAWRKVAAAAELRGLSVASHVYPEIGIHLMAAAPNALTLEIIPWWPRFYVETLEVSGGAAKPSDAPGIGITLDRHIISRYRIG